MRKLALVIVAVCFSSLLPASSRHTRESISSLRIPGDLRHIRANRRQLVGRLGRHFGHGKANGAKVRVEYRLTAGGSALVETLFPGASRGQMVSMYYDRKGKLAMTHYCMLRNQPGMMS